MKIILTLAVLLNVSFSFAQESDCRDLVKKLLALSNLSAQNLAAVQTNLKVESEVIKQWAQTTDTAFATGKRIPTAGMRKNAHALLEQANTLQKFNTSFNTEIQKIMTESMDCQ